MATVHPIFDFNQLDVVRTITRERFNRSTSNLESGLTSVRGRLGFLFSYLCNLRWPLSAILDFQQLDLVQTVTRMIEPIYFKLGSQLQRVFDVIETVDLLDSHDPNNLQLLGRPDLNVTFTKLHCWRLTQFSKCVFMDADTLVLQNVDELFDREELSAAPDAGWPDCFNSGVFVFRPSDDTYQSLLQFAMSQGSFDGGDQGLLNMYFSDWSTRDISKHLPFIYNVVSQAFYSYLPAFTKFKDTVKIVHFIGAVKPWNHTFNTMTQTVTPLEGTGHSQEFLQLWWNIFMEDIQPFLDPTLTPSLHFGTSQSHHHDPDKEQSISCGGESRPQGTYLVLYPYVPPSLEQVFYEPTCLRDDLPSPPQALPPPPEPVQNIGSHSQHIESGHILPSANHHQTVGGHEAEFHTREAYDEHTNTVERPVPMVIEVRESEGQRPYLHYETHYSEDPISNIDPDEPPSSVYHAKDFEQLLDKQTSQTGQKKRAVLTNTVQTIEADTRVNNCDLDISTVSHANLELGNIDVTDLVGELASLRLVGLEPSSAGPRVELSDRQRKLAWERGEIDYLGRDSFSNIQRKLDDSIHNGSAEPVVLASQSSPFSQPTPQEVKSAPPLYAPTPKAVSSISITTSSKATPKTAPTAQPTPISAQPAPTKPSVAGNIAASTAAQPISKSAKTSINISSKATAKPPPKK